MYPAATTAETLNGSSRRLRQEIEIIPTREEHVLNLQWLKLAYSRKIRGASVDFQCFSKNSKDHESEDSSKPGEYLVFGATDEAGSEIDLDCVEVVFFILPFQ